MWIVRLMWVQDKYHGTTLHSAEYKDARSWKGKRVAVIGSSTTSFDICHDAAMAGATEVTMVQRGPTRVYPEGHIGKLQKTFWNDHLPVEVGDIMSSEDPIALQAPLSALLLKKFKDEHECARLFTKDGRTTDWLSRQPSLLRRSKARWFFSHLRRTRAPADLHSSWCTLS